ncbi:MAG TPA: CsbD family protein [Verrucomicrobia bacterium]|nr:CsbD family protein [Verrucomicrobiota bacterium]
MNSSAKIAKGRIEEAAGALVGNDKLRAKGQRCQAAGQVRKDAEKGVRKVKDAAREMVDKAKAVARKAAG